jgi:DNA-binding transcriptional LysR family regulator
MMDRVEAMRIFVAALDEGSLAAAGRRLGRSPAAVSRAVAFLEGHVGVALLHRTTRALRLSEAGARYATVCRRVLADLDNAEIVVAGERAGPRGLLTLTAPVVSGMKILRPLLDDFLDAHQGVAAKLLLLDRPVNLIDEGIDVALRIAHLPDSTLIAIRVGEVRRVVVAAPSYLAGHPRLRDPGDLANHQIIALTDFGLDSWSFPRARGSGQQKVKFTPRLIVNSVGAALDSAAAGHGVTRLLSYQVADKIKQGLLESLLPKFEPPPLPVHVIVPDGRLAVPKVRAFVEFAVPRLKAAFAA